MTNIVIHHWWQVGDIFYPGLCGASGRIDISKNHIGQSVAQFLTVVGKVYNRRHIFLRPIDGKRKIAHQYHHCFGIGLHDYFHQIFLFQAQCFAVDCFATVAWHRRYFPACISSIRMIAYANNGYIGFPCCFGGFIHLIARCIKHFYIFPNGIFDTL